MTSRTVFEPEGWQQRLVNCHNGTPTLQHLRSAPNVLSIVEDNASMRVLHPIDCSGAHSQLSTANENRPLLTTWWLLSFLRRRDTYRTFLSFLKHAWPPKREGRCKTERHSGPYQRWEHGAQTLCWQCALCLGCWLWRAPDIGDADKAMLSWAIARHTLVERVYTQSYCWLYQDTQIPMKKIIKLQTVHINNIYPGTFLHENPI